MNGKKKEIFKIILGIFLLLMFIIIIFLVIKPKEEKSPEEIQGQKRRINEMILKSVEVEEKENLENAEINKIRYECIRTAILNDEDINSYLGRCDDEASKYFLNNYGQNEK